MLDLNLIANILADANGSAPSIALFADEYAALTEEERAEVGATYEETEGYVNPAVFPTYNSFVSALYEVTESEEALKTLADLIGEEDRDAGLEFFLYGA